MNQHRVAPRRILLSSVGSFGDVLPFLAVGKQLVERGHAVTFLTNGYFAEQVTEHGMRIAPVGTAAQYLDYVRNPKLTRPIGGMVLTRRILTSILEPMHAYLVEHWNSPDSLIVSSPYCMATRVAQDQLGLSLMTMHLTPISLGSRTDPATMISGWNARRLPPFLARGAAEITQLVTDRMFAGPVNRLRKRCGLSSIRNVMKWWSSPDASVLLFPTWFGESCSDWPRNTLHASFPHLQAPSESIDDSLNRFLDVSNTDSCSAVDRPILFYPGSIAGHLQRYIRICQKSCALLGRRGVLVAPALEKSQQHSSANFHVCDFAPLSKLLPLVSAVVHHAGIGTVASCLRAGVPQLMIPKIMDQPDNAERARRLGVGAIVPSHRFNSRTLAKKLKSLWDNQRVRQQCDHYRQLLAGHDGASSAADIIERHMSLTQ